MANDEKDRAGDSDKPLCWAAGYRSLREPKLRGPAVPEGSSGDRSAQEDWEDPGDFGAAPEDGLRMLAALETFSSLEPDFSGELAPEEASVTIIERAPVAGEVASLQARLEEISAALDAEAEEPEPACFGPAHEATIEIFELGDTMTEAEAALARYRLRKAIAGEER